VSGGDDPDPGPGPVVDSSVLGSSVVDRDGAAVSVTIVITRAAGDRLQRGRRVSKVRIQLVPDVFRPVRPARHPATVTSGLAYPMFAVPAK
jgi:hypothetical protein